MQQRKKKVPHSSFATHLLPFIEKALSGHLSSESFDKNLLGPSRFPA
jgi:hypothetical protein